MANESEGSGRRRRTEAVRTAVDQAFQVTKDAATGETGRERAQDIVDQLAQAAGRVREVLDELRPPTGEELRALREKLEALEKRVAALEAPAKPKRTTTRRPAASKPAASKPAAKRSTSRKTT